MMTPARILIVEDDRVVARDIQHQLTVIGHTVVGVTSSGDDVVRLTQESHADLVLMDIRLTSNTDGVDAALEIREHCQVPVVFLTAYADDETLQQARVTEPFGYVLKPFDDSQLRTVIEMALYKHMAERKLRDSERRYAVTLASIGDGVVATDDRARVTYLNPVAEALTGWPKAEAIGLPLAEVFHIINEETRQAAEYSPAKVHGLSTMVGLANHTVLLARDGRAVPIDDCAAPMIDDRGRITGTVLIFRDATARRQAEEAAALRLAYSRVDLAVRGSNIGIFEIDLPDGDFQNGHLQSVNVWEQLGYERPESPADFATFMALVHPDDRAALAETMRKYLSGEIGDFEVEYRANRKDGSTRSMLTRGSAMHDAMGKPIRFVGSCFDITGHKRAEQALRESEQRFRTFVDHATDAFFLLDERRVILDVNRQACQSLGYTREELVGMPSTDLDVAEHHAQDIQRTLNTGEVIAVESLHRRKDGTVFPVDVRARAFWEGGQRCIVALARDISVGKRVQEALCLSEMRYRSLVEATAAIVWTLPPSGVAEESEQPSWSAFTGQSTDQIAGWGWLEALHPDDQARTRRIWSTAVAGRSLFQLEYRVRRRDGEYRSMQTRGVPIFAENGQIREWFGTCVDITDLKQAEQALRESEERFRGTFENAAVGIAHLDAEGRCLRANQTLSDITGYSLPELVGKALADVVHPDDLADNLALFGPLMNGDIPSFTTEKRLARKDGSHVWVYLTVSTHHGETSYPIFGIAIVQNISERKRLEAALSQASEQLRAEVVERRLAESLFRDLLESAPDAIVIANQAGEIHYVNFQTETLFGYERQELVGQPVEMLLPRRFHGSHPSYREEYVRQPRVRPMGEDRDLYGLRKDGSEFYVEISLSPLATDQGVLLSASVRDVTDRRRMEG